MRNDRDDEDDDGTHDQNELMHCERCNEKSYSSLERVLGFELEARLCLPCYRAWTLALDATPLSLHAALVLAELDWLQSACESPSETYSRVHGGREYVNKTRERVRIEKVINIAAVRWLATGLIEQELYKEFIVA